jgi:hypothetical protein
MDTYRVKIVQWDDSREEWRSRLVTISAASADDALMTAMEENSTDENPVVTADME